MLPSGFIQDLLARLDIAEVVGQHVELKRGGVNLMGLCPFHAEKSPSFSVSPAKQFYYCFGCGASGDAIRFLTEYQGLSFIEAVRDLAQRVGLAVPEEQVSPEDRVKRAALRERRQSLGELLAKAAEHYRLSLRESPAAVDYLKRRGLSGEIAARFGLGFAPPGWRNLASVFPSYDDPLLEEAGLVRQPEPQEGDNPAAERGRYDWFRDRVMFPIRSVQGEVIGFGGRVLDDSKPKYINSPETPLFSKGRELYGLFEARTGLRDKGFVLVVEGYIDVVALAQSGFANAVATLGTACTAEHVAKLFRHTESVVFSFDGDAAGRRAATRALEAALPHASDARSIRFLFLPPEHDPDSFVRALGADAFEAALAQAVPLSQQLLVQAAVDCEMDTAEGRAKMLTQARPLIEQLPAGLLREQLAVALAERGGVPLQTLQAHWQRQAGVSQGRGSPSSPGPAKGRSWARPGTRTSGRATPQAATRLDRVAWLLARHARLWHEQTDAVHAMLCAQPPPHGAYFSALGRLLDDHGELPLETLLSDLAQVGDAAPAASLLGQIQAAHQLDPDPPAEDLAQVLAQIEMGDLALRLTALTTHAAQTADDFSEIRAIYSRQAELKAQRITTG